MALLPITGTRIPDIPGELGCSFVSEAGETLLVAKADSGKDAKPSAAINSNGRGATLASAQTGGFGTLERSGARFDGRGLTITIDTRQRTESEAGEVVTHRAQLLVQDSDGNKQTFEGDWSCGP